MLFSLYFLIWIINNFWYFWVFRYEKGGVLEWNFFFIILKYFKWKLNMVLFDFFGVLLKVILNLFFRFIC